MNKYDPIEFQCPTPDVPTELIERTQSVPTESTAFTKADVQQLRKNIKKLQTNVARMSLRRCDSFDIKQFFNIK